MESLVLTPTSDLVYTSYTKKYKGSQNMFEKEDPLISSLKELIRCYDSMNNPESPVQKEITMWRNRFLDSVKAEDSIRAYFLYNPCESFMKNSPEKNLEMYKEYERTL